LLSGAASSVVDVAEAVGAAEAVSAEDRVVVVLEVVLPVAAGAAAVAEVVVDIRIEQISIIAIILKSNDYKYLTFTVKMNNIYRQRTKC
jgi:hypothetical protein